MEHYQIKIETTDYGPCAEGQEHNIVTSGMKTETEDIPLECRQTNSLNSSQLSFLAEIDCSKISVATTISAPETTLTGEVQAQGPASKHYSCKVCNICGLQTSAMKYHMIRHNRMDERSVVACSICPQTWFSSACSLQRHMRTSHGKRSKTILPGAVEARRPAPKQYLQVCKICGVRVNFLSYHMIRHNRTYKRSEVPCPICPQTWFDNAYSLGRHMYNSHRNKSDEKTPTGEVQTQGPASRRTRQVCNICGLRTPNMKKHMIRHDRTDARSVVACSICPKTWFSSACSLLTHMLKGHGTQSETILSGAVKARRPASKRLLQICKICGMQSSFLKYHMIRHDRTDKRSEVPCPICPQTWFPTNALNQHMQKVHGKKPDEVARSSLAAGSSSTDSEVQAPAPNNFEQSPVTNLRAQATTAGSFESTIDEVVGRVSNQPKKAPIELRAGYCEICLQRPPDMSEHMSTHRQEQRPLPCPIRPQTWFETVTELNCHLQNSQACAHADPLSTAHDLILNTRSQSTFESKQNDEEEIMDCAAVEDLLMSDGQAKHPIEATSFNRLRPIKTILRRKCLVCGMRPRRMNVHMQRHTKTEQRSMPCPICPQTWFSGATFLKRHVTTIHPRHNTSQSTIQCKQNDGEEIMDCAAVEELLTSVGHAQHRFEPINFTRLRPKCLVCGIRPNHMKQHMLRHTKTEHRSVPCPFCPQTWFSGASEISLKNHLTRIHAGEYDTLTMTCARTRGFQAASSLPRHLLKPNLVPIVQGARCIEKPRLLRPSLVPTAQVASSKMTTGDSTEYKHLVKDETNLSDENESVSPEQNGSQNSVPSSSPTLDVKDVKMEYDD